MTDNLLYLFLVLVLMIIFVGWVCLVAYVMYQLRMLMALVGLWREGRRFFKKIERFRRDFS